MAQLCLVRVLEWEKVPKKATRGKNPHLIEDKLRETSS